MNEDDDSFLQRWSARKRRGPVDPAPADEASAAVAAEPAADAAPEPVVAEPPPLTDADMPPIETLDGDSDVSGFFSSGVSAALRRAALRHVFGQARFNVRDGLNDYDGDYTVFEPLGDTITADMKFHTARKERLAREREEALEDEREAAPDDEHTESSDDADAEVIEAHEDDSVDAPADKAGEPFDADTEPDPDTELTPRQDPPA